QRREELNQQILDVNARRLGIPALRDKDQLLSDKKQLEQQIHHSVPELLKQDQQLQFNHQAAQQITHALRQTSISLVIPALADKSLQRLIRQLVDDELNIDFHSLLNRDWIDISPLENKLDAALQQQLLHNQLVSHWFGDADRLHGNLRDQLAQERDKR